MLGARGRGTRWSRSARAAGRGAGEDFRASRCSAPSFVSHLVVPGVVVTKRGGFAHCGRRQPQPGRLRNRTGGCLPFRGFHQGPHLICACHLSPPSYGRHTVLNMTATTCIFCRARRETYCYNEANRLTADATESPGLAGLPVPPLPARTIENACRSVTLAAFAVQLAQLLHTASRSCGVNMQCLYSLLE